MKTHPLISSALCALKDTDTPPPVLKLAADVIIAAAQDGILPDVDAGIMLVWRWLKAYPESYIWATGVGLFAGPAVCADAIDILRRDDGGTARLDLAFDILSGSPHVSCVGDELIVELVERFPRDEHIRDVAGLVVAVHRARSIPRSVLTAIRDRWAESPSRAAREAAITMALQLVDLDLGFVERMLNDPDVEVRASVARQLCMPYVGGAVVALPMIETRLRVETHPEAHAALLQAQANIERDRLQRDRLRS